MKLIDAETRITALIYQCENEEGELEWHTKSMTIEEFLNEYADQGCPKLKTGKWITKSNITPYYTEWWYECSECGQKPLRDRYEQEVLSDYCTHCGARMVGEDNV